MIFTYRNRMTMMHGSPPDRQISWTKDPEKYRT